MALNIYYLIHLIPYRFPHAYAIMIGGMAAIIICSAVGRRLMNHSGWKHMTGALLILYWLFFVISMTIFGRTRTEDAQIELQLFWCVREAWNQHDPMYWFVIVGNIVLFIPIGFILPAFFDRMRCMWKTAVAGFAFSTAIEVVQLVFHLGLFELDDFFNNTLGCILGYALCVFWMEMAGFKKPVSVREKVISVGIWILTLVFFAAALLMGQPVFRMFVR